MNPVRLLVAGAANPHVRNYYSRLALPEGPFEVAAIADFDPERQEYARAFFSERGLLPPIYRDWQEMFDRHPDAEAVMVGTDNRDHFPVAAEALRRRKHIFSMKVVSMDERECEKLIAIRDDAGVAFQVELELRFCPQYRYARRLLAEGRLGRLKAIYLTNVSQSPINYFPNWGDPELSYGRVEPIRPGDRICRGGALTDHPHPFDLVRWLTGREFRKVFAVSGRNQRDHLEVEDHVAVTGELDDGTKFFANPSYSNLEAHVPRRTLRWPKALEVNLKLTGEKGFYSADYFDRHAYVMEHDAVSPDRLIVAGTDRRPLRERNQLSVFHRAVRFREPVESTLEDGLAAVRVMNAAYESISLNRPVLLSVPSATVSKETPHERT